MKGLKIALITVGLLNYAAFASECVVVEIPTVAGPHNLSRVAEKDAPLELAWDNGTVRYNFNYYTGANLWCGNDFSSATLKAEHVKILKFKMYTRDNWPNSVWDGFRIGFYGFAGGIPGSRLWPTGGSGYFFKPSGLNGHVWVECPIDWTCPTVAFVAAAEQVYNYPNTDPFSVDTNPTFRQHSWIYADGVWGPLNTINTAPYHNLMIRVQVETELSGIAPATIGRVKALYY